MRPKRGDKEFRLPSSSNNSAEQRAGESREIGDEKDQHDAAVYGPDRIPGSQTGSDGTDQPSPPKKKPGEASGGPRD